MNRRSFLKGSCATALIPALPGYLGATRNDPGASLVPSKPSSAPNYFCTWAVQNYMYGRGLRNFDRKLLEGDGGAVLAREAMTEAMVLGPSGWAEVFHPRIREDLFFLLDDGWESGGMASFVLDEAKFPSMRGEPVKRLQALGSAISANRWRGAGLWCRNPPTDSAAHALLARSAAAGIHYWKIDIGDPGFDLPPQRNSMHLPLTLEHVHGELPLNGNWRAEGRFGRQLPGSSRLEALRHTDVYRTYDVTSILSLPTTLDRVAEMMRAAQQSSDYQALLNVEDEVYVAAVLGCTMGVMRHPLTGLRVGPDTDLFFNGPRQAKRRMDEVVRALRWQRIAPPFSPGQSSVRLSEEILTDSWVFRSGETWQTDILGAKVNQAAPAVIARDLPLPVVKTSGEKPYVCAARFPSGAVSVGSQQRTKPGHAWFMPQADILVNVGDAPGPFGIFGHYASLTLHFDYSVAGRRVRVQDLAGERSFDVTAQVQLQHRSLTLPGALIESFGSAAATPGDLSSPGLLLQLA